MAKLDDMTIKFVPTNSSAGAASAYTGTTTVGNVTTTPNTTWSYNYWPQYWGYQMTEQDVDRVADRVVDKLKASVLTQLLEADPGAVAKILLAALNKK